MKTLKSKGTQFKVGLLAMAIGSIAPFGVFAQDALLEDANQVFNSDQIDIDGDFTQPRVSPADKMEKLRKKIEQQNEDMVNKRIEDIRTKNEQKLAKDLQKAFNGNGNLGGDQVSTTTAAVVKAPAPVVIEDGRNNRVIPKFGITNYDGEDNSLESNISFGINVETDVHERVSIGIGAQYTTFDLSVNDRNYNYYYGNNGVDMSYSHLNLELNSKFYFTANTKIRPFAGLGIGYNRSTLEYREGDNNNYSYYNYGNDIQDVTSSFISASGTVGAEMSFSETMGALLEFRYNKALTTVAGNSKNRDNVNNPYAYNSNNQNLLDQTNEDIKESSQFAVNAGIMIKF